jgi:hypothetical protein
VSQVSNSFIIALDTFIVATRDSGYKGTPQAIAELIDNAIQAGATQIHVSFRVGSIGDSASVAVSVVDNGSGMDAGTLRQALRFGGSTRFNNRNGIGRYGMGLPNASLSQARRLDVYTWQSGRKPLHSYLDVDEIAHGHQQVVPPPRRRSWPAAVNGWSKGSGTLIEWSRCDRLDNKRATTLARKLIPFIGRVFRYFIWDGVKIIVNDECVEGVDPLYLHPQSVARGARLFGEPVVYEVQAPAHNGNPGPIGKVQVTFAELPVHDWHDRSNDEKRRLGVLNGAGVSVIRAGREIDYGWFFLSGKRRENYDDWWRCEIQFDPVLDEAFGLAHTKQQIRPTDYLSQLLASDMESIARTLNSRVRQAHLALKAREQLSQVERLATERDGLLKPLPRLKGSSGDTAAIARLAKDHAALSVAPDPLGDSGTTYTIVEKRLRKTELFGMLRDRGRMVLLLNPDHPFYKQTYRPLAESDNVRDKDLLGALQMLLLSAARARASFTGTRQEQVLSEFLRRWSDTLATLVNG